LYKDRGNIGDRGDVICYEIRGPKGEHRSVVVCLEGQLGMK